MDKIAIDGDGCLADEQRVISRSAENAGRCRRVAVDSQGVIPRTTHGHNRYVVEVVLFVFEYVDRVIAGAAVNGHARDGVADHIEYDAVVAGRGQNAEG